MFSNQSFAFIEFSAGIGTGPDGQPELVNYRAYRNVLIGDLLFEAEAA
jgi:hypothetical protein